MKKIFLMCLVFPSINAVASESKVELLSAPTYTKVVKNNRGLFGYQYVDQTGSSGGDVYLLCSKPGSKSCNLTQLVSGGGGLPVASIDEIQTMVDQKIIDSGQTTGNFIYNSDYYVMFSLDLPTGETTIEILTRDDASARNISF